MAKKLVVAGISGTIYDAVLPKTPNVMTSNRTDRTDECISAVAEHMKFKADYNKDDKGFWQYRWKGIGTLTWQSEKAESEGRGIMIETVGDLMNAAVKECHLSIAILIKDIVLDMEGIELKSRIEDIEKKVLEYYGFEQKDRESEE